MSKYGGPSLLADVATELTSPASAHYPIRRKGERRRLNPNWNGIDWLEGRCTDGEDFLGYTEIVGEEVSDECKVFWAAGTHRARARGMYVRPMFQLIRLGGGSARGHLYRDPCPGCDDWSRSSRCAQHHDRDGVAGLALGVARGRGPAVPRGIRPPGSVTIEVNGETVQGVLGFSYQAEGEDGRGEEAITYYS